MPYASTCLALALALPCGNETLLTNAPYQANATQMGSAVDLDGDRVVVGAYEESTPVFDAGAAHVFERDQGGPGSWGEVARLLASDASSGDRFGFSAAVDGDRIAVGATNHWVGGWSAAGSVYLFERDQGGPGAWGEVVRIDTPDPWPLGGFGFSVDLDGDRLAVGAWRQAPPGSSIQAGTAYLFERDLGGPGAWGLAATLVASDGADSDFFGRDLALEGDVLAVGAPGHDLPGGLDHGAVYVFERDLGGPGAWGERTQVLAQNPQPDHAFGTGVALDAGRLLVGATGVVTTGTGMTGAAFLYERDLGGPDSWGLRQRLDGSNLAKFSAFGVSAGIQGNTAIVGALFDEVGGEVTGSAHLFREQAGSWSEVARLVPAGTSPGDRLGEHAAVDGDTVIYSATGYDVGPWGSVGVAYVSDPEIGSASYCTAGTSAHGCQAQLATWGVPSASIPSGFLVQANQVEGAVSGLFYYSPNGRQASPWGNGTSFQCVVPPVARAGLLVGSGTSGLCDGAFEQDFNALWAAKPQANPGAGAVVGAQLWYRDPQSTSNQTTSLSNAVEFLLCP